jgi:hypothetical protein
MDGRLDTPTFDQHLDSIIADLRDRGVIPRPLNVIHHALEIGLPEPVAANLAALLECRTNLEGASASPTKFNVKTAVSS